MAKAQTSQAHPASEQNFDIVIIAQAGRWQYEAALFALSLRAYSPRFSGKLYVAEPQPGPLWPKDPRINDPQVRGLLRDLGAEILPFENRHFGAPYPYGNKIEALSAMPDGRPFLFFDSDTLITDELRNVPFDFSRPSASLRVSGTWPELPLYGPDYAGIWGALYGLFGLDMATAVNPAYPPDYWRHYPYFNAGFFYYHSAPQFGERFAEYACTIRDRDLPELACQSLDPWLDQVALPLVIHSFGGGAEALPKGYLDGSHSCHYRLIPLLYARESDAVVEALEAITAPQKYKKVLKAYAPFKRLIYQGKGREARTLFDQKNLPRKEQVIRNRLRNAGYWMR